MSNATIEIPGMIMLAVPSVTPRQAVNNFDEVVGGWSCNRDTRMALEQSVKELRKLVDAHEAAEGTPAEDPAGSPPVGDGTKGAPPSEGSGD